MICGMCWRDHLQERKQAISLDQALCDVGGVWKRLARWYGGETGILSFGGYVI